jgi:hypothetical protein
LTEHEKEKQKKKYRQRIQETKDANKTIREYTRKHTDVGGFEETTGDEHSSESEKQMPHLQ